MLSINRIVNSTITASAYIAIPMLNDSHAKLPLLSLPSLQLTELPPPATAGDDNNENGKHGNDDLSKIGHSVVFLNKIILDLDLPIKIKALLGCQ